MPVMPFRQMGGRVALVLAAAGLLSACQVGGLPADLAPIPNEVMRQVTAIGSTPASPIYVRIFKEEEEFELWKRRPDDTYALLDSYEICAWSGVLGPKFAEGDRQAPEGFYTVGQAQMNPNSSYHLSFNIGYPNVLDQALGRTGSNLMVHGACSSAGCYAMTDETVEIIYALAREAFRGGQRSFNVHAFPFRMTPENFASHWGDPNMPFWLMLKEGYDHFEVTRRVPDIEVCELRYVFNAEADGAAFIATEACPDYRIPEDILAPLTAKQEADEEAFQIALAELQAEAGIVVANERGDGPATLLVAAFIAPAEPVDLTANAAGEQDPDPVTQMIFDRFFTR